MNDWLISGLFIGGLGLLFVAMASYALHFLVALKSPPVIRAAWTAGTAYLLVTLFIVFGGMSGYELYAPLALIPSAVIAFLYWRYEFRRAWIDDPDLVPDDAELAEDDWKMAVLRLVALIVLGSLIAFAKTIFRAYPGS